MTDLSQVVCDDRYAAGCCLEEHQQRSLRRLVYALAICYERRKSSPTHAYGLHSARRSDNSSTYQWTEDPRLACFHTSNACIGHLYMRCCLSTLFRDKTRGLPFTLYRGIESDRAGELSDENNGLVGYRGGRLVRQFIQSQLRPRRASPDCRRRLPVFICEERVVAALGFWIWKSSWRCFALHGRWSRGTAEKSPLYSMSRRA